MQPIADSLTFARWELDLQPARAVCELFDFLEEVEFWIKNRAGRYCWVNVTCLMNYRLNRREEMVGKTDQDLSPAHIAAQFRADDELVLSGHEVTNRIELVGRFDYTARWCMTFKRPLHDAHGHIIGTAGISRPLKTGQADWLGAPLSRVINYISKQISQPLDNAQLARVANCSERTFERRFRQYYALSPQQYVKRLRVRMACHALIHTDHGIGRIALAHGFVDQSLFTRQFRQLLGQTPGEYRRSWRV